MFVWDEARRRENLWKSKANFADAEMIFRGVTFAVE
jgi:uncharacterized DUF497 family protein